MNTKRTKLLKLIRNISLIAIGAALTLGGIITLASKPATIKVVNNSNSAITRIKIIYEDGVVYRKHLGIGKQIIIPIAVGGESSYKIYVKLKNGKMLKGGLYVENGYSTKELVTDSAIKSEHIF